MSDVIQLKKKADEVFDVMLFCWNTYLSQEKLS